MNNSPSPLFSTSPKNTTKLLSWPTAPATATRTYPDSSPLKPSRHITHTHTPSFSLSNVTHTYLYLTSVNKVDPTDQTTPFLHPSISSPLLPYLLPCLLTLHLIDGDGKREDGRGYNINKLNKYLCNVPRRARECCPNLGGLSSGDLYVQKRR